MAGQHRRNPADARHARRCSAAIVGAGLRAEVRRHPCARRSRPRAPARREYLVAAGQRKNRTVSRPRRGAQPFREKTERPGHRRRRDRRARRRWPARRISAAAEPHPPYRIEQPVCCRPRRLHRIRSSSRGRRRSAAAEAHRAKGATCAAVQESRLADPQDQRRRGERWPQAISAGARPRLGRADRQRREFRVPHRQAHA